MSDPLEQLLVFLCITHKKVITNILTVKNCSQMHLPQIFQIHTWENQRKENWYFLSLITSVGSVFLLIFYALNCL